MRTNTLSINRNSQNDKMSYGFRIKKITLSLCLLGALVVAGFRAPMAEASCQGCSNSDCIQFVNGGKLACKLGLPFCEAAGPAICAAAIVVCLANGFGGEAFCNYHCPCP